MAPLQSSAWSERLSQAVGRAFGFLTTDPAEPVKSYHAKAMPVILTVEAARDLWMSGAPWSEVAALQRPLPDGALKIVARGSRQDDAVPA